MPRGARRLACIGYELEPVLGGQTGCRDTFDDPSGISLYSRAASVGSRGKTMAEQPKTGSVVHVEFHVKEPKKLEKFYGAVFGWKFQEVPGMDYSLFQAASGPGGGVGGLQPGNWQSGVINYLSVPSVDEYQEKVKKAGGKIIVPKAEVMGQGWFAVFEDPSGTRLALWQQNPNSSRRGPSSTRGPAGRVSGRPFKKEMFARSRIGACSCAARRSNVPTAVPTWGTCSMTGRGRRG